MGERFLACLRWSARALVMMSERVGDSLSGRLFCFRKSKSEAQRAIAFGAVVYCASSYLSSLPSGRAGGRPPLNTSQGKCKANAEPSSLELC